MTSVVCAARRDHSYDDKVDIPREAIAIAGNLQDAGGSELAPLYEPVSEKHQGVRVVLQGGALPLYAEKEVGHRKQRAVVEFICHEDKEGTEGEVEPEDVWDGKGGDNEPERRGLRTAEDAHKATGERQVLNKGAALVWESYGPSKDGDVDELVLTWYTKHACLKSASEPVDESKSWGVFTWLVILYVSCFLTDQANNGSVFLGVAAYLIFGSWLNYTRYGARGWDLLPHGDMLRDIPFLLKDWLRLALNTMQGSGGRGGYSAV